MGREYVPYPYQSYCHSRIIDTPRVALFLDMGLGKTVITLTALNDLKYNRFSIRRMANRGREVEPPVTSPSGERDGNSYTASEGDARGGGHLCH